MGDLGLLLRQLRREHARRSGDAELTYRELAERTGWSVAAIGEYFAGTTLPPTDRFDVLVRLLGATAAEQGALATARDVVEEHRRRGAAAASAARRPRRGSHHPPGGGPPGERPVPRQLPPDVPGFTGRAAELAALDGLLGAQRPNAAVVSGTAGVGKTALVVHWAHRVAGQFPGGQLYADLRGFGPAAAVPDPGEVVRGFLEALAVPPQRIPLGLDAQVGLYRSLVTGRRVLVVLDNAHDVDQVRPLLPGCGGCLALVTSRRDLAGLSVRDGARPLGLDLLSRPEAAELLAGRVGSERVGAEPDAVAEIVTRCARLPLALAIVAARAAAHPQFPLGSLAAELRTTRNGLDALDGGDAATDVRAVFSWSYQALSTGAARLFRLLGIHPGPDIAAPAAASVAGVPPREVRPLLTELARAHLVTERAPGRYAFHDLLRAYATELAQAADSAGARQAALRRTLDHYLHTADPAASLLHPLRERLPLPAPEPDTTPEEPASPEEATAWFEAEHRVLLAAAGQAGASGSDTHACRLAWALAHFFDQRGHWHDQLGVQHTALRAAQRLGDRAGQARTHRFLANAYLRLGRVDQAQTHHERALELHTALGDRTGQAHTHRSLGWLFDRQGRTAEALRHAEHSLDLFTELGDRGGQASALNAAGWYHSRLGDHERALAHCQRALRLLQDLGDRAGEAATWDSVGYAHHHLAHYREAVGCYDTALALVRELGDRYHEANILTHLGQAHEAAGDADAARLSWRQALAILDDLGHPDAAQVRAELAELAGLGTRTGAEPGTGQAER